MSLNTTPRTWVTGEFVTAAMMNTEIRDALAGVQSAWTAWTPTFAGAVTAIGNATIAASYQRYGKDIRGRVRLAVGSTTTFGAGTLTCSLPVSLASNYDQVAVGTGYMIDTSAGSGSRTLTAPTVTGSGLFFVPASGGTVTNLVPWTWAVGDLLAFSFMYEAA